MREENKKSRNNDRGLRCRKCGCQKLRVVYTRGALKERLVRSRKCHDCGERIMTYERMHFENGGL